MATSRRCGVFGDLRGKPGNFGGFAVGFGGPGGARPAPPPSSVRRCAWLVGFVDSRSSSQQLKASGSWDWRRRGLGGGVVPVRNSDAPLPTSSSVVSTPRFGDSLPGIQIHIHGVCVRLTCNVWHRSNVTPSICQLLSVSPSRNYGEVGIFFHF